MRLRRGTHKPEGGAGLANLCNALLTGRGEAFRFERVRERVGERRERRIAAARDGIAR